MIGVITAPALANSVSLQLVSSSLKSGIFFDLGRLKSLKNLSAYLFVTLVVALQLSGEQHHQ
jgi:hypothetical protein